MGKIDIQDLAKKFKTPDEILSFCRQWEAREHLIDFAQYCRPGYQAYSHHKQIADLLERVERGECRRAMIFMPPRHGKSYLASETFPAWYLGRDPRRYIISISYNDELATWFGRSSRNLVNSDEFKEVFPGVSISHDSKAQDQWTLIYKDEKGKKRTGGTYRAAGIDGAVTGKGANLILIDDPVKGYEVADSERFRERLWNFYQSDLYSRQQKAPDGALGNIVIIQTRWHEDDLSGRLLRIMQEEDGEKWEVLELPAFLDEKETQALWPEYYPPEELQRIKRVQTNRAWQALYMQRPVADEGNIIKRNWWREWDTTKLPKPLREEFDLIIFSLDTAYSTEEYGSYSALTIWGIFQYNSTPAIMLLDAWHDKMEYAELRKEVIKFKHDWDPDLVIVEKKSSGISLSQDLKRLGFPILDYKPDRDKTVRVHSASAMIEAGLVWYLKDSRAAEAVIDECAAFPTGASDDFVDTMSQSLIVIREHGFLQTRKLFPDWEEEEEQVYAHQYNYY